jgi:hypothetical protein
MGNKTCSKPDVGQIIEKAAFLKKPNITRIKIQQGTVW